MMPAIAALLVSAIYTALAWCESTLVREPLFVALVTSLAIGLLAWQQVHRGNRSP